MKASLDHIDNAVQHLREVGHMHGVNAAARMHLEFAAAHLRQAWIAEDGQHADTPEETYKAVAGFYRLQEELTAKQTAHELEAQ